MSLWVRIIRYVGLRSRSPSSKTFNKTAVRKYFECVRVCKITKANTMLYYPTEFESVREIVGENEVCGFEVRSPTFQKYITLIIKKKN